MPNNLSHKQQYNNSCGAACLMVAAKELGVDRLPGPTAGNPHWNNENLEIGNKCESSIYAVTCETGVAFDTYSMPDGIAKAAQFMGLRVNVYMSGCMMPRLLSWKYAAVVNTLETLGVRIGGGTPTLSEQQRMLVVVGVGAILGLHYVLYRSDGSYMDPAYGTNYNGSLWGMGQMYVFRYVDTGIYIVVSR